MSQCFEYTLNIVSCNSLRENLRLLRIGNLIYEHLAFDILHYDVNCMGRVVSFIVLYYVGMIKSTQDGQFFSQKFIWIMVWIFALLLYFLNCNLEIGVDLAIAQIYLPKATSTNNFWSVNVDIIILPQLFYSLPLVIFKLFYLLSDNERRNRGVSRYFLSLFRN